MKKITVSCIGLGQRGHIYLSNMNNNKDKYEIISVCDFNSARVENFKNEFNLKNENCFTNDKDFFRVTRSDLLLICTQDKDHVPNLLDALKCGYKKILVEKPFATTFKDIKLIEKVTKKYNADIYVCHVLRYAPAFLKIKQFIDSGRIGELKSIDAIERVGLSHEAHSYVRGNYARKEESSPMIMAKCCHDLDLLVWYANSLTDYISSTGSLSYFVKECKPKDASDKCFNCKLKDKCYYNAEFLYSDYLKYARDAITDVRPITDEAVNEALKTSRYGTCVWNGNNNVVDDQTVTVKFKNGVNATLRMTAFVPFGGRRYMFYGTEGCIELDNQLGTLVCRDKYGKAETIKVSTLITAADGHAGGDKGLILSLYDILVGKTVESCSSVEYSIESHKMALFAEKSRLKNGKRIKM